MTRRDWSLIAALAVLWGSAFILIEIGLRYVPPNTLVFARMALAVPPLLLLLRLRGESLPRDIKSWGMLSVLGTLNVVLPFILFYWGMTQISTGLASILNATTPLWGVVAAHFLTRDEKATPARIIGVLFGVAGIAVMIGVDALSGMTSGLLAQIACLIATLCYALASIYGRKFGESGMAPLSIATGQVLTSAIIMLPIALISDAPWTLPMPGLPFWAATGAIAVFSTSLAYYLYFQLLESAGASNSLLVTFLIPIVAIVLGAAFLGESFSINQAGGIVLIALGLIMLDGRVLRRGSGVMVSEELQTAFAKANELVVWINIKLDRIEIKDDHRHRIPAQLFDLAIEHHSGIIQLLNSRIYASACALVRCEFECFVRGAWLHYCASDDEIESFIENDRLPLKFSELIDALEQKPEVESKFLSKVKIKAWASMNSYTHGGVHQIFRRLQDGYIEPNFEDAELLEVTQFSGMMALIAFGCIAELAGRHDLVDETYAKLVGYF